MRIAFRTDASLQIGTGHVMRCLALADALREHGAQCTFACRPQAGHLLDLILQRGHQSLTLPPLQDNAQPGPSGSVHAAWLGTDWVTDAADTQQGLSNALGREPLDWLVVDHYALDHRWEQALRSCALRIMVIDDLADRPHVCDLLLDQNLGRSVDDYSGLLPPNATLLIGPQYALLRPEFARLRSESLSRRASPKLTHLLITMGGVDKDNATGQVLDALNACALPPDLHITVVMGPHAPWLKQVREQAAHMNRAVQVLVGVREMARLMADSDLAIGAAGGTSWERCCLGLPSLVLVLAENQQEGAMALQQTRAAVVMQGSHEIPRLIEEMLSGEKLANLQKMGQAAAAVTDGSGVATIVERMMNQDV